MGPAGSLPLVDALAALGQSIGCLLARWHLGINSEVIYGANLASLAVQANDSGESLMDKKRLRLRPGQTGAEARLGSWKRSGPLVLPALQPDIPVGQ